jgi:Leucine-rich repeat (LRR) protein
MKYLFSLLLFFPEIVLGQIYSTDTLSNDRIEKREGFDLVIQLSSDSDNEKMISESLKNPSIKKYNRILLICAQATTDIPNAFIRYDWITRLRITSNDDIQNSHKNEFELDLKSFKLLEELEIINLPITSFRYKAKLPKLKSLKIQYTSLKEIPEFAIASESICELSISHCDVKEIPTAIKKMKCLKKLDLSSLLISSLPKELFTLSNLLLLNIDGTDVSEIPDEISQLQNLEWFSFLTLTGIEKCSNNLCALPKLKKISGLFYKENVIPSCLLDASKWKRNGTEYDAI